MLGAKLQLAEVFHEFVLNVLPGNEGRPSRNEQIGDEEIQQAQCDIIDAYCLLMAPEQNKEV